MPLRGGRATDVEDVARAGGLVAELSGGGPQAITYATTRQRALLPKDRITATVGQRTTAMFPSTSSRSFGSPQRISHLIPSGQAPTTSRAELEPASQ